MSLIIVLSILWCLINLSRITYLSCAAVCVFLKGIILAYFVNLSIITKMLLYATFVAESCNVGNPVTKSIVTSV